MCDAWETTSIHFMLNFCSFPNWYCRHLQCRFMVTTHRPSWDIYLQHAILYRAVVAQWMGKKSCQYVTEHTHKHTHIDIYIHIELERHRKKSRLTCIRDYKNVRHILLLILGTLKHLYIYMCLFCRWKYTHVSVQLYMLFYFIIIVMTAYIYI